MPIMTASSTWTTSTLYNYNSGGLMIQSSSVVYNETQYSLNIELIIWYITLLFFLFFFCYVNIKLFVYWYKTTFNFVMNFLWKN
jgi:hypothetical protein